MASHPGSSTLETGPALVRRERLLSRLVVSQAPVVAVSAPAGAGKSTLASQWQDTDGRRQAVLHLTRRHNDPVTFALDLIGALESLGAPAPRTRAAVSLQEPVWSADVLPAVARLARTRDEDFLLVLDDVHLVTDPRCLDLLVSVASAVTAGSQVVLLTRDRTPPWLAQQRAEGRLLEIGPADLALDVTECRELFRRLGLSVSEADALLAVASTEGWAVGLYLTALAVRDGADGVGEIATWPDGSDRFVVDYLRTQVLDGLDADSRDFLVQTAVLEELTAPACDALLQRTDSAARLAAVAERIQLVVPLDRTGRRFRYHHLLQEALAAELAITHSNLLPALHRRAARWFESTGDRDAAVDHAIAAGDLALAGRLIWSGIVGCVGSGRRNRLHHWISGLSDQQIAADPWLTLAAAWWGLQSANLVVMDRWLLTAEGHAGAGWRGIVGTDEYAASLAMIIAVRGAGGLADTGALCEGAFAGLPSDSGFRASAAFLRGVVLILQRDLDGGRVSLAAAIDLARALDVPLIEANTLSWQGVLAMLSGDWPLAKRLIRQSSDILVATHLDRLGTSAWCVTTQALVLAADGDHDRARATLATARRMSAAMDGISPWFRVCGRLVQARTAVLLRDGATARQLLSEARDRMASDLGDSLASDLLEDTEAALKDLAVDGMWSAALTAAELRVLQFLPTHLTYQQIGEHLFLSQNTIKAHTMAIYRKLGVSSRADAVDAARALGLLDAPVRD